MLTIGGFSKLGQISARMLRHYDAIGLLKPAYIAENGYRYYDDAQLPVLKQIESLKGYGFSLAQVKELIPLPQEELAKHIHTRRLEKHRELNELRAMLRLMERDIEKMEGTGTMTEKYHVIIMDAPEQKVFGLRKTIDISETHDLFQELYAEMKKRGLKRSGATQLVYLGDAFSYENMDVEAQAEVSGEGEGVKLLPGRTFAAVTHIGPYETVRYAYEALGDWIKSQAEYEVCGPGIERYIRDEGMVESPEELETGVLFPVRKVK